jgi:pimeloyl-ACP methyl ester carboxylesterase
MAGVMMKRILKAVVGSLVALLVGLALLGLAKPDHAGVPVGVGGQLVTIDGVNIRYVQKGAGRDLLLIHGTPSSLEEWQPVFDRWASKYRVTAYDRPGHGYSGPPAGETGIDYNAHMARRLMEELHLHDVLVVGHSYGGPIALKLAADDDSPATAFMIVASTVYPIAAKDPYAGLGKLLRLPLLGRGVAVVLEVLGGGMVQKGMEQAFHPDERLIPAGFIKRKQEILLQPKVTLTLAQEMKTHPIQVGALAARYPSIKRPVSIVVGSEDQPRVVEGGQRLAREIPGAHLTVLEHAGHMLQFTRPDELTALLDAALATPAR